MIDPSRISHIAIYPPLGLARVGNAPGAEDFFLASEVRGRTPTDPDGYRDGEGRIKRQAVRFRVFAHLKDGAVAELVAGDGVTIDWRVRVANLKAGWYDSVQAMDVPAGLPAGVGRRNARATDRAALDIVPEPVRISGAGLSGPQFRFDGGTFHGKAVYLGELRTDEAGRLIFLGGLGLSEPRVPGTRPTTFANNEEWHDDTCDGSVHADVTIGESRFSAEPAAVAVAPPNFAPGIFGVVTMEDVVLETFIDKGWLKRPAETRFTRDIWPIFERMTMQQWVDHGLYVLHGTGSTLDAGAPDRLARLRDISEANRGWRQRVAALFRDPDDRGEYQPLRIPQFYGDAFDGPQSNFAQAGLAITPTMYAHIQRWANGVAEDDWLGPPSLPDFDSLTPAEQVSHLERAFLYECLGGPFHPGIELSWTLRQPSLWKSLFRLNLADEVASQDYGPTLTPQACFAESGPLAVVAAGSLTRWMGVPWQTDEASCNSDAEYSPSSYLSMPSFWGPRVPNQMLSSASYGRMIDPALSELQALKYYGYREDWLRDIRGTGYLQRIDNMVREWWQLGMALPARPPNHLRQRGLPDSVWVERGRHPENVGDDPKVELVDMVDRLDEPPTTAGLTAERTSRVGFAKPKRTFRRGEI